MRVVLYVLKIQIIVSKTVPISSENKKFAFFTLASGLVNEDLCLRRPMLDLTPQDHLLPQRTSSSGPAMA